MSKNIIKINGEEVKNPILRVILVGVASIISIFLGPIILVGNVLLIYIIVLLFPLWLVMHLILRAFGRKGIIRNGKGKGKGISVIIDAEAFRRKDPAQ